jgi:hypothetical protein
MPEKTQTVDEILATNPSRPPSWRNAIRRSYEVPAHNNSYGDLKKCGTSWSKTGAPGIPSAAELNSKKHNIQTLRQLCDAHYLDLDGRRYVWSPG